jgi:hypothetical protein
MTKLLGQAVAKARAVTAAEHDSIAPIVIDEFESKGRWDGVLAKSPQMLPMLADSACVLWSLWNP